MAKLPAFQFYPGDWLKDVELHMMSTPSRGIWIEMLCLMWSSSDRGKLEGTITQLARICRCLDVEMTVALEELSVTKTAIVTKSNGDDNSIVTVINRRMHREEKERKSTYCRVKRHREKELKRECNIPDNAKITVPSSSSSSSSSSNLKDIKHKHGGIGR